MTVSMSAVTYDSEIQKAKGPHFYGPFYVLAPRPGLEPGTYGLTVRRSTN